MSTEETVGRRPGYLTPLLVVSWLWVAVPFCYGLYELVQKIPALFST